MQKEQVLSEKEDNLVDLDMFRKGRNDGKDDENWLANIPEGTCFLSRTKAADGQSKDFMLSENHVIGHFGVTTLLLNRLPDDTKLTAHVDTLRFSRNNVKVNELGRVSHGAEVKKEEEDTPNG